MRTSGMYAVSKYKGRRFKYIYTVGILSTALETIPYVYGDSNWKDKLTSYNSQTITYDAIGSPPNDSA